MPEIVPAALAVKSMRDNGYKNAAYALAELIDNSIQAEATNVELLIGERFSYGNRQKSKLENIAILDNGLGMSPDTLAIALQFGNGTHLEHSNQQGIGKFGMGLPAASISQCKKVEVWSWQDNSEDSFYTYFDLDEISNGTMEELPTPIKKKIPNEWINQFKEIGKTGTFIVWAQIDKCHWKKGNTIIKNSESLIGRIYRYFLHNKKVSIRMLTFDVEGEQKSCEYFARPNDPMYLMDSTSCPAPWNQTAMFERWGKDYIYKLKFREEEHDVVIRYSIVKKEIRKSTPNAGSKDFGKHAAKNLGVSIIRAQREITLDQSWAIQYDTTERWWGVEVEFPPGLDEVFGLTNNKQSASFFEDLTLDDLSDMTKDGSLIAYKEELKENNDPTVALIDIANEISKNIKEMRKVVKSYSNGSNSKDKRSSENSNSPESSASDVTKQRKIDGHEGQSDAAEEDDPEQRKQDLSNKFVEDGYDSDEAISLAELIISKGIKFHFETRSLETSSFFTVRNKAGVLIINLNSDHPAYKHLIELLEEEINEDDTKEELIIRVQKARDGLLLLIAAWARYEDEQISENKRDQLKDIRSDWGKVARGFFRGTL